MKITGNSCIRKVMLASCLCLTASMAHAYWGCCRPCYGGWHWGPGGRNFWPGFVGGLAAGLVVDTALRPRTETIVVQQPVVQQPVIVQQPVVVQSAPAVVTQPVVTQPQTVVVQQPAYQTQNVWVDGRYVDTVQANGTVLRTWQPGHYEQRTVQVR